MEQARWNEIEELLQAALDLEPGAREAFLRGACGDDDALYHELEAMLAGESDAALLETPAVAALAPHLADLPLTGQHINHYRIEARIGQGGMGDVYRAHDETLQRTAALKTLPPEFTADEERVRRFEQEAFAASRLNHPNIVTIFEILHDHGAHFIATELVEGETLRELLTDPETKEPRPIAVDRALDIAMQVAAALKAAHTAWIIHRDVKPENIMVRADGLVKVLDFGIAKLNDEIAPSAVKPPVPREIPRSARDGTLTDPGAILGTANYMSPEQARGEPLDGRTDLYSLGLILYEMVAGARPTGTKDRFDHVPKELQHVIRRMLEPDREERYGSAGELLDDLAKVRRRIESRTARRMVGLGILAVVVAVLIITFAALLSITDVWDERVMRDGHTAAARQAIFSPDGQLVVSCGEDGQVIVWDFAGRERLATLNHPSYKVVFSPDGHWFATGGTDGTIAIWDAKTRQRLRTLREQRTEITALGVSADSTRLAAASLPPEGRAVVWDTVDWKRVGEYPKSISHGALLFSPDRRQLVSSTELMANWAALSPDATRLFSVNSRGSVRFSRLTRNGDLRSAVPVGERIGHQDHGRSVAVSPDGRLVASAAEDIVLWDAATQQKLARFEYSSIVWSVAFSPEGRWLISSHGDGAVLIWDVAERQRVASLNEHSGAVRAVAFTSDGRRLASGGEDRMVTVWNVEHGRKEAVLAGHPTRVTGVAFSADGSRFASVDQDGLLIFWDLAKRQPRLTIRRTDENVQGYCLAMSSDGSFIATTHGLYATSDGHLLANFTYTGWPYGHIYGAAISPDGRLVAGTTDGGWLVLWDVARQRLIEKRHLAGTHQIAVAFSHDGKWLATGEDEALVRLWSVQPLEQAAILGRHAARVKSIAFSPDGATVASAGDDKMIALWDVKRHTLRSRIGTHASPVYAIAFSADGRRLASGEHDRTVRVYTRRRMLWGLQLE
jgi:WD40 repeat protein